MVRHRLELAANKSQKKTENCSVLELQNSMQSDSTKFMSIESHDAVSEVRSL